MRAKADAAGILALALGAAAIGLAPILVRLSETGPVATAFHRLLLAQPLLWWLWWQESSGAGATNSPETEPREREGGHFGIWMAALAGVCFALDLGIWHWSLKLTTVANSTLFSNLAPFFVMVAARFLFGERISPRLGIGMAAAMGGGFLLVAESLRLEARFLVGDLLGVVTALFYASYLLCVKALRRRRSTRFVMAWSGVFAAPTLFLGSWLSGEVIWPASAYGWAVVGLLALVSHVGGQGLITYGLAHISAAVSAVLLMLQPVVAAGLAWAILGEALTPLRGLGGVVIIGGILVGTWRR